MRNKLTNLSPQKQLMDNQDIYAQYQNKNIQKNIASMTGKPVQKNVGALEAALQNNIEPQFNYAQYQVMSNLDEENADSGQVNIMIGSTDREFFPDKPSKVKKTVAKGEIPKPTQVKSKFAAGGSRSSRGAEENHWGRANSISAKPRPTSHYGRHPSTSQSNFRTAKAKDPQVALSLKPPLMSNQKPARPQTAKSRPSTSQNAGKRERP
jgi:hypothetical protein